MSLKIQCPNCNTENLISDIELSCQNEKCVYKFKVFDKKDDAEKFRATQPSTEPKRLITHNNKYIVCYCYIEVEPFRVKRLTDVIDENTVRMLLRGFAFHSKPSLVIIEPCREPAEEKKFRRIEPYIEYGVFCKFIRNLGTENKNGVKEGEIECKRSVYKIAKELFNKPANKIYEKPCWTGLKKHFLPLSINNINVGMLVCSDIKLNNDEERKRFLEEVKRIPGIIDISEEEFENLNKEVEKLLLSSKSSKEMGMNIQEIKDLKDIIERISEDNYLAKRKINERLFLDEIDALFSVPIDMDYTREHFIEKINTAIKRMNEFCEFETCIFLTNETNTERFQILSHHSINGNLENKYDISINIDESISELLEKRKNHFYSKEDRENPIFDKFMKILKPLHIKAISICPFNLIGDNEGLLLLINRTKESYYEISGYTKEFINGLLRDFVNHLRGFYTVQERKEHIALTFHTMNQSMDTLMAKATFLHRVSSKKEVTDIATIKSISKEIESDVEATGKRVETLYYYTAIGTEAEEYRFDKPFAIINLIKNCRDRYLPFAQTRGIEIFVIRNEYDIPDVFWDKGKIDVAVSNVLHNAIKFSHYRKDIKIYLDNYRDLISIDVNNFGFGIAIEDKEGIFNEFKRSKLKDPRRPIPGSGLGLSVARRFIEKHGGTIRVTSKREGREHSLSEADSPSDWESFNTNFNILIPIKPE